MKHLIRFYIIFFLLSSSSVYSINTRTWDGGGADANWTTAANWSTDIAPVAGDALVFTGNVQTTTNNDFPARTSFNSITLANNPGSSFTLSGNSIIITGGLIANDNTVAPICGLSISLDISFSTVAPSITSSSANGMFTISGQIDNGGLLLTVAVDGQSTISGIISGTGGLTKNGVASLILSGANTYSGPSTLNAGYFKIGHNSAFGSSILTINSGLIDVSGSSKIIANNLIMNGSWMYPGSNLLTFNGNVTLTNNVTITVQSSSGTGRVLVFNGIISGPFNITRAGTVSSISFTNSSSDYTGKTSSTSNTSGYIYFYTIKNVGAGTSSLGAPTSIANGTISLGQTTSPGSLSFEGSTSCSTDRIIDLASTTAQVTLRAKGTSPATITFLSNILVSGNGVKTFSLDGTSVGDNTFAGVISNGASTTNFNKTGIGTWLVSGLNTYTGTSTITGGTLKLGSTSALGTTANGTNVSAGATLDLNGINYTTQEPLVINGFGVSSNGAISNSNTSIGTYSGPISLGAASSIIASSGDIVINNTGTITGSGFDLTLGGAANGTLESILGTATGALVKQDADMWTLSGANTYTGATNITAGTIKLNNPSALGTTASGTILTSGAALDLNGVTYSLAEPLSIAGTGLANSGAVLNSNVAAASFAGAITLTGATTITANNQITLSGDISNSQNLTKEGADKLIFTSNAVDVNDITISSGTLNAGASTITVHGNFTNNASFTPATSTVQMKGSSPQTISAANFNNLVIDNAAGVSLTGNISVSGTLTLTTGILNTGTYSIDLGTTGTIVEATPNTYAPTSYVTGTVKATRTLMQNVQNTFGGIGVDLTEANLTNNVTQVIRTTGTACPGNFGINSSIKRYFTINPTTDIGLNGSMVFHYFDHEIAGQTEANLRLYKSTDSRVTWIYQSTSSVTTATNRINLAAITSFSDWTGADYINNSLPIELISFEAHVNPAGVLVQWETASETNNKSFELQRSIDGQHWNTIHVREGMNNSLTPTQYQYIDSTTTTGTMYYRLIQIDFDGTTTISKVRSIDISTPNFSLSIYPVPANYNNLVLEIQSQSIKPIQLSIFNLTGNLVCTETIQRNNINQQIKVNSLCPLSPGTFILQINGSDLQYQTIIILK